MYKILMLLQSNDKTVAAELQNTLTKEKIIIPKQLFLNYKGKLSNAIVDVNGVVRGKTSDLPKSDYKQTDTFIGKPLDKITNISKYLLMYEEKSVLSYDKNTDILKVYNESLLPFKIRNKDPLKGVIFWDWLKDRVDNLSRTYMNMVYIARKVGRDKEKIIIDSSAISITDNYWVKTSDISPTWLELKALRDHNQSLNKVALTGKLVSGADKGVTSLFTLKGHFSKCVAGGYIYKLQADSILEYPAYILGKRLGIKIAECGLEEDLVRIKVFTSYARSLVHASELKEYYNTDLLYNGLLKEGRADILYDMQRMYIFNYIIGNPDLHEDNYGCIYDSKTFEILELAPCYDHNLAFQEGFNGLSRETVSSSLQIPIVDLAERFIINIDHKDILDSLKHLDLSKVLKYLSKIQLAELKERIDNIIRLCS